MRGSRYFLGSKSLSVLGLVKFTSSPYAFLGKLNKYHVLSTVSSLITEWKIVFSIHFQPFILFYISNISKSYRNQRSAIEVGVDQELHTERFLFVFFDFLFLFSLG